jgi:hypothetical protein
MMYCNIKSGVVNKKDNLMHCNLLEEYTKDTQRIFGYDEYVNEKLEDTRASLNNANNKIRELEKALGDKVSNRDVILGFQRIQDEVKEWWSGEGFTTHGNISAIDHQCVEVILKLRIDDKRPCLSHTLSPNGYDQNKLMSITHMKKMAERYDIYQDKLIDNDKNRGLVVNLIKESWPMSILSSIKNRKIHKEDIYELLEIKFYLTYSSIELSKIR